MVMYWLVQCLFSIAAIAMIAMLVVYHRVTTDLENGGSKNLKKPLVFFFHLGKEGFCPSILRDTQEKLGEIRRRQSTHRISLIYTYICIYVYICI